MNHLHLIIPALILPAPVASPLLAGLRLPYLERLLARGRCSVLPPATLEDRLCHVFGVQSAAPLRAQGDGLFHDDRYWLCADPVELQLQSSRVVLYPDVDCSRAEAEALCEALNAHFSGDGLFFHAPHPNRWYLSTENTGEAGMAPLRAAAWRDIGPLLAQDGARRWQRLGNEIQMLLHQHPVNLARQLDGRPAINSLWLWGGGHAAVPRPELDVASDDGDLISAFARASGVALQEDLSGMLASGHERGLYADASLRKNWQRGDLHTYRGRLEELDNETAAPVWHALRGGKLRALTLEAPSEEGGHRFDLSRADSWRIWHRPRPLASCSV